MRNSEREKKERYLNLALAAQQYKNRTTLNLIFPIRVSLFAKPSWCLLARGTSLVTTIDIRLNSTPHSPHAPPPRITPPPNLRTPFLLPHTFPNMRYTTSTSHNHRHHLATAPLLDCTAPTQPPSPTSLYFPQLTSQHP